MFGLVGFDPLHRFFCSCGAKILVTLELGAEAMATSAYNLGKSGLASKVLRTKDLISAATEGVRAG